MNYVSLNEEKPLHDYSNSRLTVFRSSCAKVNNGNGRVELLLLCVSQTLRKPPTFRASSKRQKSLSRAEFTSLRGAFPANGSGLPVLDDAVLHDQHDSDESE